MLSQSFPAGENTIGADGTFISPPPLAWLFVPLVAFPEPVAYVIWTLVSLAALGWAWYVAAPYRGLAKVSLLLLALGLWPVMQAFYYGQPAVPILGLVALAWWLMQRDHPSAGGVALAVATALKPQVVVMIPAVLLVTGRWRAVAGWAGGCAALAVVSALALGTGGLASYWEALKLVQSDVGHAYFTPAYVFGFGSLTLAILVLQGAACIAAAIKRRDEIDVVFALGLLGSLMVSVHLHQMDYSNLVLAAWLVLRGSPPMWRRIWLLSGILTMQLLSVGQPIPQLVWDVVWLAMLGAARSVGGAATARRPVGT